MKLQPKTHTARFLTLVEKIKQHIHEITVAELKEKFAKQQPFYLIDVREQHEVSQGVIPQASALSKGVIEMEIEKYIPDDDAEIIVYCGGGYRSALVADNLQRMGYTNVHSLQGGFREWVNTGNAIQTE